AELLLVEVASRQGVALPSIYASGGVWPTLNYLPMRAADGRWIQCGNLLEHLLMACLDAMGLLEELLVDERFQITPGEWSAETVDVVRDMMLQRALTRNADDWMEAFRSNGNVAAE